MPINLSNLAKNMNSLISSNIKKQFKDASPGDNMKKMTQGIAAGFAKNVIGKTGQISGGGAGGVGMGIIGVQPKVMTDAIIQECRKAFGTEGPALKAIASGIAEAVVKEIQMATITGDTGGIASKFNLGSPKVMGRDMLKATGFKKTEQNEKFFIAISSGIIQVIEKNGKSIIPPSGPGGGPKIAVIS